MVKFKTIDSKGRGRPRANKSDKKGHVRVSCALVGAAAAGNVTRSFTVKDMTVTAVYKMLMADAEVDKPVVTTEKVKKTVKKRKTKAAAAREADALEADAAGHTTLGDD
jgi:hypothetical protein